MSFMLRRMEPHYGRSRVYAQWLDTEDTMQARTAAMPRLSMVFV